MISPAFIENPIRASKKDLVASYIEFKEAYNDLLLKYHEGIERQKIEEKKFSNALFSCNKENQTLLLEVQNLSDTKEDLKGKLKVLNQEIASWEQVALGKNKIMEDLRQEVKSLKSANDSLTELNKLAPETIPSAWQRFVSSIKKIFGK